METPNLITGYYIPSVIRQDGTYRNSRYTPISCKLVKIIIEDDED